MIYDFILVSLKSVQFNVNSLLALKSSCCRCFRLLCLVVRLHRKWRTDGLFVFPVQMLTSSSSSSTSQLSQLGASLYGPQSKRRNRSRCFTVKLSSWLQISSVWICLLYSTWILVLFFLTVWRFSCLISNNEPSQFYEPRVCQKFGFDVGLHSDKSGTIKHLIQTPSFTVIIPPPLWWMFLSWFLLDRRLFVSSNKVLVEFC